MKIYVAIGHASIVREFYEKTKMKSNVLISYPYLKGNAYRITKTYRKMLDSLFLDSGAYTLNKNGFKSSSSLSAYKKYITMFGHLFDHVVSLDSDFNNPDKNFNNQMFLEKDLPSNVPRPIPVVHDVENPFEEFESYADQGHNYIAIGSNKKKKDDLLKRIKKKYPKVKVHVFGDLSLNLLRKHKPDSADSANWGHAAAHGNILFWDEEKMEDITVYVGDREKESKHHYNNYKDKLDPFLWKTFKFEYKDLLAREANKMIVNLYFYKQLENYLNAN